MLTKITKQGRQASSKTMAERFLDFQVEEIQELNENSENQNTKKGTSTSWLMKLPTRILFLYGTLQRVP